jgi:16S rRNA (guanine527-N7)-methyltransferase
VTGAGTRDRVQALAERYALTADARDKLTRLLELVAADTTAPTTIRDPVRILEDHLADSLAALEVESVRGARCAADLGAGAGFPGLPLAVALPGLKVTLLESSRRKCEFIERAIATCAVQNAIVVCCRAESWQAGLGRMDLITARALAPLPVVAEYAAPLLRTGGTLIAWRGKRDPAADAAGSRAAEQLGLRRVELRPVRPYPSARHRHLDVIVKLRNTPSRFPRRPGVAAKRPLGAPQRDPAE